MKKEYKDKNIFNSSMSKLQSKQDLLLNSLIKFYNNPVNKKIIIPIIKQETAISLRLLDWLVTNYSKKYNINYELSDEKISDYILSNNNFNLWLDYKNQLKAYSKRLFDPFCRRQRIFVNNLNEYKIIDPEFYNEYDKRSDGILTTVGQLNFFKWAIVNRVIDYAFENLSSIESDMLSSADEKINIKNKFKNVEQKIIDKVKKRQLSKNNSVKSQKLKIIVQFS